MILWKIYMQTIVSKIATGVTAMTMMTAVACAQAAPVFQIQPVKPLATLLPEALRATPPAPRGDERQPDLVELTTLDPDFRLDIRYATSRNFLGEPLYSQARAFLERPAAEALARVLQALKAQGYGLLIFDGYRPWYVTKLFWDATPSDKHMFVADPALGSMHNRGCAVDLSLYELKTGQPVEMPSGYDEMTRRAYADYAGGTEAQNAARALLRDAMAREGFTQLPEEWWHFDYRDWRLYPVQNIRFEDISAK